ncbi:MAG: hypothetical protein JO166_19080 [Deltaproteobacteria bacterium]|nr:hypothetical protein [Deltaproteobacteria bacterium]
MSDAVEKIEKVAPSPSQWLTVLASGVLVVVPQAIAVMPGKWRDIATALFGVAVAAWHLYQTPPTETK